MKNNTDYYELEQLKKENQMLQELLTELPMSFTFQHKDGYMINKVDGHPLSIETSNEIECNKLNIMPEIIPFKEIELFVAPILNLIPYHIVFLDSDGIMTFCNDQAAVDHGEAKGSMVGRHIRDLIKIPDEKIIILESLRTNEEIIDREVLDRNYYKVNTKLIHNSDGSINRVIGVFYYLKSIKEAEKQAVAGRIAAGIAHEIRNPLTTVRGYLQLLQSKVEPKVANLFSELLIPEIDRANKIITDFLAIAKPAQTNMEWMNAGYFLNDYLITFLQTQATLYNVDLQLEINPNIDNLFFMGDREELLQVFMNLMQNSIQAKNSEKLKITIQVQEEENYLQVIFADNGSGISPEVFANIFEPFFSTKDYGTGLGLSVSKKIIENHSGLLTAKSNQNGTTFYIELPIK